MKYLSYETEGSVGEHGTDQLRALSIETDNVCLQKLGSAPEGITNDEAKDRIRKFGYNEIRREKPVAWYKQLLQAFLTPFNAVLAAIAVTSFLTDVFFVPPAEREFKTVVLVSVMVLLSSLMRFWQEYKSNMAARKLKSMIKTTATVIRKNAGRVETPFKDLVPGDIINLSAGDMVPADCRVLESKDLFISQAILSGESLPVEKKAGAIPGAQKNLYELENICFMGTNVASGTARAVVATTGDRTYFASISRSITQQRPETSFDKGIKSVSWLLIRFIIIMVPIVFLVNALTKGDWLEAFLFAISIAVGLTPEMLPMIVTTNLAKGAITMSNKKVIVKKLNAIQNIGAMDILCTDKTGTLTMDKIVLKLHLNVDGENDDEVLKWAFLNSYHQTGLKSLLDTAILEHSEVHELLKTDSNYKKIDEIPFDFQRRRMSVVLNQPSGKHLLICKGALEEMLSVCSHAFDPGEDRELHIEWDKIVAIDEKTKDKIIDISQKLNEEGLRVLLLAIKEFDKRELTYSIADEKDLILTGFIAFLDPAKPSARPSLEQLRKLGVEIKVLTGDNETVTKKICRDVGLETREVLLGHDIDAMGDDELFKKAEAATILAKLDPMQKLRVVSLLRSRGHTVGFLGDGINDAPALRSADVGISVDTAVDIAKESADIILLEKDLTVLQSGVEHGRQIYGNIIKYIKMAASSNFGNMFSVLGASLLLPFLPMLPVQILVQNLLYDISQLTVPWDKMDAEFIEKPRKWDASGIGRFMLFIGPISSVFDYVTFGVLYFVFKANSAEHQSLFQSGWFIEGLLSQTLIVHMIRTRKIPFVQSNASLPVIVMTLLVMAVCVYIPFSPLAPALYFERVPASYFLWLVLILFGYCLLTQIIKTWFIKKFNYWL